MSANQQINIDRLKKKEHYLQVINQFATSLLKTKTVDDIVWTVAKNAIAELGYEDCVVYLVDENQEYLIQKAAHGPKNPIDLDILNPIKIRIGEGIVGHVAKIQQGEIVNDTRKDPRYILDDDMRLSEIAVPIIYDNQTIGVIDSEHHKENFYPAEDLDILVTIASMTATKLIQARNDEKLQEYQNDLKTLVHYKTLELNKTLTELKAQTLELTDSINYAKRIQKAILKEPKSIQEFLPESFIFYRPKDIIAGDFYLAEKTEDKIVLVIADCTGHGVPGAIISVVCHSALKRAMRRVGLSDAAKILDETRSLILETFKGSSEEIKDGMDIGLCIIDMKNLELNFSGANTDLIYFQNKQLNILKANKEPVGFHLKMEPYTNHRLQLNANDCLYMFTDGFSDQFGGPKGKKFKHKQVRAFLIDNHTLPMQKQYERLVSTFKLWKGDQPQVDDICAMGVKI